MGGIQSQWLSSLLGFAAFILGLSVLVQIVQEAFKYLLSSKSKSFSRELTDFLGPWAGQLKRANFQLTARGPFQFLRVRPRGELLPMNRDQLVRSLIKTSPPWIQKINQLLNQETNWQAGAENKPSAAWVQMLEDLGKVEKGMLGYWNCYEVVQWLEQWGHKRHLDSKNERILGKIDPPSKFKAKELLESFQERFLSHVLEAKDNFSQFENNFEYAYRRKNLKQTIFIALVMSLAFNFSVGRIWNRAQRMSPNEAASLAETYFTLYQNVAKEAENSEIQSDKVQNKLEEIKILLADYAQELAAYKGVSQDISLLQLIRLKDIGAGEKEFSSSWIAAWVKYFFQCLLTAILVGVGAPVWNDLVSFLLGLQKGKFRKPIPESGGSRG